jgi:hypothetical protein
MGQFDSASGAMLRDRIAKEYAGTIHDWILRNPGSTPDQATVRRLTEAIMTKHFLSAAEMSEVIKQSAKYEATM